MPIYQLEDIPEEFVTPKHSTAYGRLITGTQVEVGLLRYKAGEGAKQHAHPMSRFSSFRAESAVSRALISSQCSARATNVSIGPCRSCAAVIASALSAEDLMCFRAAILRHEIRQ